MPDSASTRRRRARRRRVVAAAVTVVVVAAGGGTAWALTRSSATSYRVADVSRATIAQTVDADGSLAARNTATESFAAAGTVKSVAVKSGQQVTAGQTLATLDRSSLESAVSSAKNTLASAKQTLADNEAGQASTSSSTSAGSTGSGSTATDDAATTTGSADIVLVSDESDPSVSKARAEVTAAQKAVVRAQQSLDGDVADLTSSCTTAGDTETTEDVTADGDTVSGTVDRTSVVTIADDTTTSENPQTTSSSWNFAGLTDGQSYKVVVVPVVDSGACTEAIEHVSDAEGSKGDTSTSTLYGALGALTAAVQDLETAAAAAAAGSSAGGGSGTPSSTPSSGAPSSGSPSSSTRSGAPTGTVPSGGRGSGTTSGATPSGTSGSGSSGSVPSGGSTSSGSGSSTTTTISAARIAADQKAIDAARAALKVAHSDMSLATLSSPISGTVASVGISAGSSVSASSGSDTIVVTADRALSMSVDISLADIDLIKVGETASVTVDGRSTPLAAKVSTIGVSNTSSSSGSSSEYAVTLVLDRRYATLYDGMGASAAIDVGAAKDAISVPVSAVTTSGTVTTVDVVSGGRATTTRVTLGVEGRSVVQVTSGLEVGQEVALADLDEPLPSSDSTTGSTRGGLSGGGFTGGGFSGGAPGGGFAGGGR